MGPEPPGHREGFSSCRIDFIANCWPGERTSRDRPCRLLFKIMDHSVGVDTSGGPVRTLVRPSCTLVVADRRGKTQKQ